ncbi:SRPBCC domain-containing protein [Streptomyces sp. TX20-6-3]|uniref:SRPBCC family protein n=1 Tax=Streptomyces sp. TX20-6-3 TaxID=3028705 RepID=UPI0029AA03A4|nr:SRPBCC domain-containing protein [Streptomyces sp. TX20-6-3]MDX2564752.1 SRPBCC domain-containing protein [Streptomyces sp. TX20-6-3]
MTIPPTPMDTVTLERRIAARPETVFGFLTDREKWLSWMGADGSFSFEPGGSYRTRVTGESIASGRFITVSPHRRVVFSWGWESGPLPVPPGSSTIEITLEPTPDGTLLHLIHSGLPSTEACEAHAESWQHYVDRLATRAEGGDPGPDSWLRDQPESDRNPSEG